MQEHIPDLTVSAVARACGGQILGGLPSQPITGVVIDSRKVLAGSLFVALPGERTDGHAYVESVLAAGAAAALVTHIPEGLQASALDASLIVVPDTRAALQQIARWYRQQFSIPVIGVTGSVGKTTAKEMVASVLSQKYCVHRTEKNLNNDLGVPLTLLQLRPEHTAAVVEMGISDFGEMRLLTDMVRPTMALFTVIGCAHLEKLGDRAGVLRAKGEILEGMDEDGIVVVNGDDDQLRTLSCPQKLVRYGLSPDCDVRAEHIHYLTDSTEFDLVSASHVQVHITVPGAAEHMVYAALEGAAVGFALGLTPEQIATGVAAFTTVGRRNRVVNFSDGTKLYDDCYNANPTSVAEGIQTLSRHPGRKVAILGDMLELGENAEAYHREMGELCAQQGIDCVLCTGPLSVHIAAGAGAAGRHFADKATLIQALPEILQPGDGILVKASHSMAFEKISQAIEAKYI